MTKVKICGITNMDDALFAAKAGADYLGFVFAKSPRKISPLQAKKIIKALPKRVKAVGIFVNQDPRKINAIARYCKLDMVQLHGDEPSSGIGRIKSNVIKAIRVKGRKDIETARKFKKAYAILLDAYIRGKRGGTGKTFNWDIAKEISGLGCRIFVAGGIGPRNVKAAIRKVRPFAVDSSSGVEKASGIKDHVKVRKLIRSVKG